jgi:hypothetical protein
MRGRPGPEEGTGRGVLPPAVHDAASTTAQSLSISNSASRHEGKRDPTCLLSRNEAEFAQTALDCCARADVGVADRPFDVQQVDWLPLRQAIGAGRCVKDR